MANRFEKPATNGIGRQRRGRDREPVALCLAAGKTVRDTAAECKVSERAIGNWLLDPSFTTRVMEVRTELFDKAVGKLADLSGKAADVLGSLLDCDSVQVRRQTATSILELAPKIRESTELAREVAALKKQLAGTADDLEHAGDAVPGTGSVENGGPGSRADGDADAGAALA
jgi:hypothetical protein